MERNKPLLIPKKKKYKETRCKKNIPAKFRRKIDPNYTNPKKHEYVPYSELSEDARKRQIIAVAKSITARMKRSPRFRRYRYRLLVESQYRLYHNKTKVCTICERTLGTSYFDKQTDSKHSKNYRRTYCIDCRKTKNREYYLKRKERLLNDT